MRQYFKIFVPFHSMPAKLFIRADIRFNEVAFRNIFCITNKNEISLKSKIIRLPGYKIFRIGQILLPSEQILEIKYCFPGGYVYANPPQIPAAPDTISGSRCTHLPEA